MATSTLPMSGYTDNKAKHAAGSGYGSCSTASCHGGNSPIWGAKYNEQYLYKMPWNRHGYGQYCQQVCRSSAEGYRGNSGTATGTGQVDTTANSQIGAHQTHLQYFNGLRSTANDTNDDRCSLVPRYAPGIGQPRQWQSRNACIPGSCYPQRHHDPELYRSDMHEHILPQSRGTGGSLASGNAGDDTSPDWNNAVYLGDTLKTQANCDKCTCRRIHHGRFPPQQVTPAYAITEDCAPCHGHNGDTTGAVGQRHMDGVLYGGGDCTGCR